MASDSDPASAFDDGRDLAPDALQSDQEFAGFGELARYLGLSSPQEPQDDDWGAAVSRYRHLWADAAKPEDYAALRAHDYAVPGDSGAVPVAVETRARELHEAWFRKRSGGRRGGRRGGGKGRGRGGDVGEPVDFQKEVGDLLEALGVDSSTYTLTAWRAVFKSDPELEFPPLPEGYGFKGGVARKALAHALELNVSTAAVRDIDLLRMDGTPPDEDQRLGERYMTDDLVNGDFGVEVVVYRRDYLNTREITMNELLFVGEEIIVSLPALLATLGAVIRITQSQLNRNRGKVHPVVGCKAMRFAAVLKQEGRDPLIDRFRVHDRRTRRAFDFYFALQLSRSLEAGPALAEQYVAYARTWGFVTRAGLKEDVTAADAARILKRRLARFHLPFPEEL
ncbi:MAG: hypothetical protein V3V20_09910 [Algisphaera sp.]